MSSHSDRLAARAHMVPEPPGSSAAGDMRLAELLDDATAEVTDVALCARHAYWHRRSVDFLETYELLEEVGDYLDRVASGLAVQSRHIRLGEQAARWGSLPGTATESSFKPYSIEIIGGQDHLEAVALRLALVRANLGVSAHAAGRLGEHCTAEALGMACREIEAAAALVEQHLATAPLRVDRAWPSRRPASRGAISRACGPV